MSPGMLLDKYREKQRHGGSNENENKGALRNYAPRPRVQRGVVETEVTRFPTHFEQKFPNDEKIGRSE